MAKKQIPEDATVLVCGLPSWDTPWDDNVQGTCFMCGIDIIWRPHAPDDAVHICPYCMEAELLELKAAGKELPSAHVSDESKRELKETLGVDIVEETKH